jgi:hypothetical protein
LIGGKRVFVPALLRRASSGRNLLPLPFGIADSIEELGMKILIGTIAWCILFVLCCPLALLVLVLWPIVWLLALPFRLVGITFSALFAFLQALLFLPARVLGGRPRPVHMGQAAAI